MANRHNIFTGAKWNFGQGNIFTPVCHSVHRGEYLTRNAPPAPDTPCTKHAPHAQVHPQTRHTSQSPDTPPGTKYTPLRLSTPPGLSMPPEAAYSVIQSMSGRY